ncbi:hypothetical protein ACIBEJ_46315 [Nonomuraea sp. NPDC050790]|uniref:hypothetical protein n=1 Tax=Nonomuraea sp. NPDC050790 TaxID=3364371 RepID=UPI00378DD010
MRKTIVAVTAALACVITTQPALASAQAIYTCASGNRVFISDLVGYVIFASGCTGPPGPGGGSVAIPSGTYHCLTVNFIPNPNFLNGQRC